MYLSFTVGERDVKGSMEKTPNIIYFDLTLNGSVSALCGALVSLADVEQDLKREIGQLGFNGLFIRLASSAVSQTCGHALILENEFGQQFGSKMLAMPKKPSKTGPREPQWNKNEQPSLLTSADAQSGAQAQKQHKSSGNAPKARQDLWSKAVISLLDLKNWLQQSHLDPMVQTTCLRIVSKAFDALPAPNKEKGILSEVSQRLLVYALGAALALDKLNPVGIGCSEIPFNPTAKGKKTTVSLRLGR